MKTKHNTFTVYRDKRKEWRWRLKASNGHILADSGEGYKRKRDCLRAVLIVSRGSLLTTSCLMAAGLTWDTVEKALRDSRFAVLKTDASSYQPNQLSP